MFRAGGEAKGKVKSKWKGTESLPPEEGEKKGDLLIRDLWTQGKESIHNMRDVNTDVISYQSKNPERFLDYDQRENKNKYINVCLKERLHFNTFVASVDVILMVEAEATLKRITRRLAQK